jgi:5-methylcytosine-specific restriction protein B
MREDIKEILTNFFEQTETDNLTASYYPAFFSGLKLKAGFRRGAAAKIPWVAFLGKDQKVMNGIFPVYYFFKEDHRLVLAYGISEAEKPNKNWKVEAGTKTITQYFRQFGKEPYKYGLSYVYQVYDTNKDLDWNKIETDLDHLIANYKLIMQAK